MRPPGALRKFVALLAVCLLTLAGCAGPATTGGACALEPVARVPVRIYAGLPLIDATIAGAPVRLVLDTGAERTLLSEAAVRRLGLKHATQITRTFGVGGLSAAFDAEVDAITLGGVTLPLNDVAVGAFALGLSETQVDGLLGGDVWRRFDVDLDLPGRTATLYRAQACRRAAPPWPGHAIEITGLAGPPTRLFLPVALDGHGAAAVFDTGAQVSGVSERLAARTTAPEGPSREVRMRGAGAATAHVKARRFATLRVGPLQFADPVLPILPLPVFIDAIVGEDMVRGCRAWVSFASRQLFLAVPDTEQNPKGQITLACPTASP